MKKPVYLEDNVELILRRATIGQSFDIGEFERDINHSGVYEEMLDEDLIKKINETTYVLTEHGIKVKQDGGYAERVKEKRKKEFREFVEIRNLDFQIKVNKHQYKTRWIVYFSLAISIIAIIVSIFKK